MGRIEHTDGLVAVNLRQIPRGIDDQRLPGGARERGPDAEPKHPRFPSLFLQGARLRLPPPHGMKEPRSEIDNRQRKSHPIQNNQHERGRAAEDDGDAGPDQKKKCMGDLHSGQGMEHSKALEHRQQVEIDNGEPGDDRRRLCETRGVRVQYETIRCSIHGPGIKQIAQHGRQDQDQRNANECDGQHEQDRSPHEGRQRPPLLVQWHITADGIVQPKAAQRNQNVDHAQDQREQPPRAPAGS